MREIGFWDYTCPQHGSLEHYTTADWDVLLDDMAAGGYNSLVLGIKWLTTGYRSRYDWLDQQPDNTAVSSNNATVYHALRGARQRGIKTWLLVVASIYQGKEFNLGQGEESWGEAALFDLDYPGLAERIELLFGEVVELFGADADGIVVELEFCDGEAPHRIPIYNAWAKENGRPPFEQIKNIRLEPRSYPFQDWRDFTTSRRIDMLKRIEQVVRGGGFTGTLSSLVELANAHMAVMGNTNLEMLYAALPHWPLVTYDSIYDRRMNRLATMDFCIEQPRQLGYEVYYLTRGVMTFSWPPDGPPMDLEEQWRLSLEDAVAHQPDILWFMGSDARLDGLVCSDVKLPKWGFPDPREARKRLMQMTREICGPAKV